MSEAEPAAPRPFPRVPAHAWAWLQRSRPVLTEVAERLTGGPPGPGFVDALRTQVDGDPFVRDVVVGVVAEVAFGGRVPERRPAGASWDRGLTWWAAVIAGVTPAEFEARSSAASGRQRPLFGVEEEAQAQVRPLRPVATAPVRTRRAPSAERVLVVRALRDLLAQSSGGQIPASVVRQLLEQLERL